jgi:hypothetical protein
MDWKQIDGYDNYYVSTDGQVRNASGLILKQRKDNGYYRVGLYKNKKQEFNRVHRLVALAFIPLEAGKDFVDHHDGERANNSVTNLRWATRQENNQNRTMNKNNTSGFKGVRFERGKWRAQITIDGKLIHLGYFEKIEEAVAVRSARANEVFGEFTHSCEKK